MTGTLILGLGNLVHSDDGAGVQAIAQLQSDPRVQPGVQLIDGGTLGLALLPHICSAQRLLVIDAIDAGEKPGTVMRFEGTALKGLPGKASIHQLGFADLMIALELIGESPGEVVVFGVQPESTAWGADLTPAVARAMPNLADCVTRELIKWADADRLAEPCFATS